MASAVNHRSDTDIDRSLSPSSQHNTTPSTHSIDIPQPNRLSHDEKVVQYKSSYSGAGTHDDPYVVSYDIDKNDPTNPLNFTDRRKLLITIITSVSTLVVSFDSSCFSGAADAIMQEFNVSEEIFTLGVSLYVLGFGIGPLFWAPLSEMYGRRVVFYVSYTMFVIWLAAAIGAPNITTLLIFRFLAGSFGSSTITNAGGTLSDMYHARQRGNALSVYSLSVFCGPVLGPVIGGYASMDASWRWTLSIMAIFAGVMLVLNCLIVPETYAPILLKRRANEINHSFNHHPNAVHKTVVQVQNADTKLSTLMRIALTRPLQLLLLEPIVLSLATWVAIVYGTLYLAFEAYPIVYQVNRGFNPGEGGLTFFSVGLGMVIGVASNQFYFNPLYVRTAESSHSGRAVPEDRLPMAMLGGCCVPISLFAFAWTTQRTVHWIAPVLLMTPFGCGIVLTFMSVNNYLIDCYTKYAASALAANTLLRSLFGFAFPLFAISMYTAIGAQWATTILAFLGLLCVPIPFVLYKYGELIRMRSERCMKSTRNLMLNKVISHSDVHHNKHNNDNEHMAPITAANTHVEPNSAHDRHVFHHP